MKKLTSKGTFFNKRVFPVIWFGFLGFFILTSYIIGGEKDGPPMMFIIMPIFIAVFGYFWMKKLVFELIDEVYDEGSSLLFKNRGKQVRINLRDIKNVSYTTFVNPPRVTISLRNPTELSTELSFSPPGSLIPFKKNKDIEDLINRIDIARG